MTMEQAEAQALAADEADVSVAFRQYARVWTQSEFDQYLVKLRVQKKLPPNADLYQLPHDGALVRYDILQCAHALRVREMLSGTDAPLLLMMDDDNGLQSAFRSAFVDEVQQRRADLAVVSFDKGMTNDARNQVVAAGQSLLAGLTGTPISAIREPSNEDYAQLVDFASYMLVAGWPVDQGKSFAFSRKSEPNKVVRIPTWLQGRSRMSAARMLRRATLRSVDSYFHKFRPNVRFASRPAISTGSTGHVWD